MPAESPEFFTTDRPESLTADRPVARTADLPASLGTELLESRTADLPEAREMLFPPIGVPILDDLDVPSLLLRAALEPRKDVPPVAALDRIPEPVSMRTATSELRTRPARSDARGIVEEPAAEGLRLPPTTTLRPPPALDETTD